MLKLAGASWMRNKILDSLKECPPKKVEGYSPKSWWQSGEQNENGVGRFKYGTHMT